MEPIHKSTPRAGRKKALVLPLLILSLSAFLLTAAKIHTYHEPLDRDITLYAVIAHEMLGGRGLYTDLFDHKPPGVLVTYALGELLAGYGEASVFLLNWLAALATMLGVFAGAWAIAGRKAGLWAAAIWTLLSGDMATQANQPNTEAFINVFCLWGFALLAATDANHSNRRYAWVGFLLAMASWYKQVAALCAILLGLAHVLIPPAGQSRLAALRQTAVIGAVGVGWWAATFGTFALLGRFDDFWGAVFGFNMAYAAFARSELVAPAGFLPTALTLFFLAFAGSLAAGKGKKRATLLLAAFFAASLLELYLPGRNYSHYYQLLWPSLIVGAGSGIGVLTGREEPRYRRWGWVAGIALCLGLLCSQIPNYFKPAEQWSREKYGETFINVKKLGIALNDLLAPGETFYVLGDESGLYFYSRRKAPTCSINTSHMMYGPERKRLRRRALEDLQENPPRIVVVCDPYRVRFPVTEWIEQNYVPLPGPNRFEQFQLLVRKDEG